MLLDNECFDEEDYQDFSSRSKYKSKFALAGLLIALTGIGSTLAANINIGLSQTEFGQGIQITSACDSNIGISPVTTFKNDATNPGDMLTGMKLSHISTQCKDKLFVLRAYSETGAALSLNSNVPFSALKFHFSNGGWTPDVSGCLFTNDGISNTAEDNSVYAYTLGCLDDPGWKQRVAYASQIRRFTLETRQNTVKTITINYSKGDGRKFGWVYDTGEEGGTNGFTTNLTSISHKVDTLNSKYISIYVEATSSEFNSPAATAALFSATSSLGGTCTNKGLITNGASRSPGITSGYYWTAVSGVEFVCEVINGDTLTIS